MPSGGTVAAAAGGVGVPVVFESGSPGDSATWMHVTPLVGTFARAIAYNRAGYEPSDQVKWPRRFPEAADDLVAVVRVVADEPAVIVAHSAGGLIARRALAEAPALFRAAVLVDTTPVAGLGVMARLQREVPSDVEEFDWAEVERDCRGLDKPGALGALPIAVLRAGRDIISDAVPAWYRDFFRDPATRQSALQLSSQTQLTELEHCGHNVPWDDPRAVGDAVSAIVGRSA